MKIFYSLAAIFVVIISTGLVIAAWPTMPIMGVIAIGIALVLATGAGLIGLYWLWARAERERAGAAAIRLEAAKVHGDNSALVLNNQVIQLQPGCLGYGTVNNLRSLHIAQAAPSPVMASSTIPVLGEVEAGAGPEPVLPTAPTFESLINQGWQPARDNLLLGFTGAGPLRGTIEDLLSVAIAGRPPARMCQGKTTLLRFVYAQHILAGGRVIILDPHGSITDSIATAPRDLEASSAAELSMAGEYLIEQLERRLQAYRAGRREFTPMLALCDELPIISLASKAATGAVGRLVLEGRKVSMYSLISGQGLPADNFGGRLVRDALSSRYVFKTSPEEARRAGLDKEAARMVNSLERGRAILAGPVAAQVVAIPDTTGQDLARLALEGAAAAYERRRTESARQEARSRIYRANNGQTVTRGYDSQVGEEVGAWGRSPVVEAQYRELPAAPEDVLRAYNAFCQGANTARKMQSALSCSTDKANRLLQEIRRSYNVS